MYNKTLTSESVVLRGIKPIETTEIDVMGVYRAERGGRESNAVVKNLEYNGQTYYV
jgi:hypothetical protein